MRSSEHIPVLPAMPKALVRRRRRSYRPLMAAIVVSTIAALGLMTVAVRAKARAMADESFRHAEELFQSGAFAKAQQQYEFFRTRYPNHARTHEAKRAAELSKLAESLDDELADPRRTIESIDQIAVDVGSDSDLHDRWPVILTFAERSVRTRLEKASRSLDASDLESGEAWLSWLHQQAGAEVDGSEKLALADLDQLAAKTRLSIAAEGRRRAFLDTAHRAIADGDAASFTEAFRAYERWKTGSNSPDPTVTSTFDNLRQSFRSRIRFRTAPRSTETAPAVQRLPTETYSLLSTRMQRKLMPSVSSRPVFARAKDLCFALDPATGTVRWVLRVGYDAPLPQLVSVLGRGAVIVPWYHDGDTVISSCDEATGDAIWSWKVPDRLCGPPAVTRDSVFVATARGTIWQLDIQQGAPRGVVDLPEPIDSPPTLREDGRGLCVVGARQGVYLFDVGRDQVECSDLALIGRRADTARCQAMWVPPYVMIFENDLIDRCYVRVLHQDLAGHREVRQVELDGRIWQPPVPDGADLLVVTDRWKMHCFGLDPGNSAVNLYMAATGLKQPPSLSQPARPSVARVLELPFVVSTDALYGYRVDRAEAIIHEVWNRPLPHPEARSAQPLQVVGSHVIAAFQDPTTDALLVQCFDARQGELVWETRLAGAVRQLGVVGPAENAAQVVVSSDFGSMFLCSRGTTGVWHSRVLDLPTADGSIQFTPDAVQMLFLSDAGTRLRTVQTRNWTELDRGVPIPSASSELALFDWLYDEENQLDGRWAVFVTRDRTLEMRRWNQETSDIHGVRIPAAPPGRELWRWRPLVSASESDHPNLKFIIVAHPAGVVCRAEVRRTEDIAHLLVTEFRRDLPPLAAQPLLFDDRLLCVGGDGTCVLLDAETLRTVAEWPAPAPIRGGVASDGELAFLGVQSPDGFAVQSLGCDDGKLVPRWRRELDGVDWQLCRADRANVPYLFAFSNTGEIVLLDRVSGRVAWKHQTSVPLAVSPQWVGDDLALATTDGGVVFVPGPESP